MGNFSLTFVLSYVRIYNCISIVLMSVHALGLTHFTQDPGKTQVPFSQASGATLVGLDKG